MGCFNSKEKAAEAPASRPAGAGAGAGSGAATQSATAPSQGATSTSQGATTGQSGMAGSKTEKSPRNRENPIVYFKMTQGGKSLGTIQMELFQDVVPATSENFRRMCSMGEYEKDGKTLGYKGSTFHRVIPGFMCQGGDFINGNGTGSTSIYGEQFDDENFDLRHTEPGMLSMANSGPNTNGCQFFLTTVPTPHLNGKHVVFGQVIDGMNVVRTIENTPTDASDRPKTEVIVADCGMVNEAGVGDVR